jgi:hypothetical protein
LFTNIKDLIKEYWPFLISVILASCIYYCSIPPSNISKPQPQTLPANTGASTGASLGVIQVVPTFETPIPDQRPNINDIFILNIIFLCFVSSKAMMKEIRKEVHVPIQS